jgi:ABC-2 type transport system permease protein
MRYQRTWDAQLTTQIELEHVVCGEIMWCGLLAALFVAMVSVALAVCLVSVGVLLAAVLKTQQQLNAISNLGSMVLAGVSGALVPLSILPGWARTVAPIAPQYWAMRGFRATILDGQGLGAVALPVGVLLGLAVVAAVLALRKFRFDEPKVGGVF